MEKVIAKMAVAQAEMQLQKDISMNDDAERVIGSSDMIDIMKRSEAQHEKIQKN